MEQPVTLNLGKPDGFTHTLSLLLDGKRSGDYTHEYGQVCLTLTLTLTLAPTLTLTAEPAECPRPSVVSPRREVAPTQSEVRRRWQVGQTKPEADEVNNWGNITLRWCGWGPVLTAGNNVTVGTRVVPWGSMVCLTDQDMVHTRSETICTEGGCKVTGVDSITLQFTYEEVNAGSQIANTTFVGDGGWTNTLYYDSTPIVNNTGRWPLEVNGSRTILAGGSTSLLAVPTSAVISTELRERTHTHSTETAHTNRPTHTGLTYPRAGNVAYAHVQAHTPKEYRQERVAM